MDPTESWKSAFSNRALATSFDSQAALYARLRPDYPVDAVDLAVPVAAKRVLDLGAGTGKLTGSLLARGLTVVAVEPLEAMLTELRSTHPRALAISGAAEAIPLDDAAVDAIMVGQAFHWFDRARALPEMARVLRPGGLLALLWNHDDGRDPLVSEVESALNRAGRPRGGSTGRGAGNGQPADLPFGDDPSFNDPVLQEIAWTRELGIEDYVSLQHTYSYVIRAGDQVRADLDREVRAILRRHQPGSDRVRIPVICQVWRADRR